MELEGTSRKTAPFHLAKFEACVAIFPRSDADGLALGSDGSGALGGGFLFGQTSVVCGSQRCQCVWCLYIYIYIYLSIYLYTYVDIYAHVCVFLSSFFFWGGGAPPFLAKPPFWGSLKRETPVYDTPVYCIIWGTTSQVAGGHESKSCPPKRHLRRLTLL